MTYKGWRPTTYTCDMNLTFSLDERLLARARTKAQALGKSLDKLIVEYLQRMVAEDDERSIEEFVRLSAQGNSQGAKIQSRRDSRPWQVLNRCENLFHNLPQ